MSEKSYQIYKVLFSCRKKKVGNSRDEPRFWLIEILELMNTILGPVRVADLFGSVNLSSGSFIHRVETRQLKRPTILRYRFQNLSF